MSSRTARSWSLTMRQIRRVSNTASDSDPSSINDRIRELLRVYPRSAYVGYTATPFANVLIGMRDAEDDDLYPRDFIFDLPRPGTYFGTERLFGRDRLPDESETGRPGLDVVRQVPEDEIVALQPRTAKSRGQFDPEVTESLRSATAYFVMATAARWARGDRDEHSSMLVHTSMYVDVQNKMAHALGGLLAELKQKIDSGDATLIEELRSLWAAEVGRVQPEGLWPRSVAFVELAEALPGVLAALEVVIENAQSARRLTYAKPGSVFIVIGGNVLSRGLTLEGLVVSYFVRAAGSYDTLLQMGRWFGYRDGYEDLPRIWMTKELEGSFADLALVEQEIRFDIARYESEGLTPRQFGPRIRCHPALSITSPLKMRRAVDAEVSFSGQLVQTIMFHHRDPQFLCDNLRAAERLARAAASERYDVRGSVVCRGVEYGSVLDFVETYRFHEGARSLSGDTIGGYIRDQVKRQELTRWNVAFIGRSDGREVKFTPDVKVGALKRSRLKASDDATARMGVIVSAGDLVLDLADRTTPTGAAALDRILERRAAVPLLLVYVLDKDGGEAGGDREPLGAVEDVIGLGIVFPKAQNSTPQTYKTAFLAEAYVEEPEGETDFDDEIDGAA